MPMLKKVVRQPKYRDNNNAHDLSAASTMAACSAGRYRAARAFFPAGAGGPTKAVIDQKNSVEAKAIRLIASDRSSMGKEGMAGNKQK